jgi:hypothetical protein
VLLLMLSNFFSVIVVRSLNIALLLWFALFYCYFPHSFNFYVLSCLDFFFITGEQTTLLVNCWTDETEFNTTSSSVN